MVATKNITVTGSMNTSADLAALVAGGDISITGQGTTTSSFQGLILAEGSFKAKDTTLIGSALTLDKNGSVQLERVRTVAARDLTKIDLNYAVELKKAVSSFLGARFAPGESAGILYKGDFIELKPSNYSILASLAPQMKSNSDFGQLKVKIEKNGTTTFKDTPSAGLFQDYNIAAESWGNYSTEVQTDSVTFRDVFQLDFNKFLKTKGGLRPLLQRVAPL